MRVRLHMWDGNIIEGENIACLSDELGHGRVRVDNTDEGRIWYDRRAVKVIEIAPEEMTLPDDKEAEELTRRCATCALNGHADAIVCAGCVKHIDGTWRLVNYRPPKEET